MAPRIMTAFAALALLLVVQAAAAPPAKRHDVPSPMALGAASESGRRTRVALRASAANRDGSAAAQAEHAPHPASWFGDFSQAESTFTEQGIDGRSALAGGWGTQYNDPYSHKHDAQSGDWFQESASAGETAAWQTFPTTGDVAGNRQTQSGAWRSTPEGYVQDYAPSTLTKQGAGGPGTLPAPWFDSNVLGVDGFGRQQPSYPDVLGRLQDLHAASGGRFAQRAVSAALSCSGANCTARSELQAFDAELEEAHGCAMSVHVRPTGFAVGAEALQQLHVNSRAVATSCGGVPTGCKEAAEELLFPCASRVDVDALIGATGRLDVRGSIGDGASRCNGRDAEHLSGVVSVACLVRNKTAGPPGGGVAVVARALQPGAPGGLLA